jgi:phosphoribosylformylglycinamidine cyclo-ligase
MTQITYKDAGVDTAEGARAVDAIGEAVRSTYTPEVIGDLGGFGGLFSAAALREMTDPVLVSGTDGVGTKIELARRLGNVSTIGIDLVAMCVNDIVVSGARPLFFLDYLVVEKLEASLAAAVVGGIAEGCRQAGCALVGGEMAEHPGTFPAGEFDLAGFAVGVVDRPEMIGPQLVQAGDVILGLAASGLHSNGFSLTRKVLRVSEKNLSLYVDELGETLGETLLTPTKIYVKPVLALLEQVEVHGIAHITGGGFYENIPRSLPKGLCANISLSAVRTPPIFRVLLQTGDISQHDMFNTYNMGVGMSLIVPAEQADLALRVLRASGEEAYAMGEVVVSKDGEGVVLG